MQLKFQRKVFHEFELDEHRLVNFQIILPSRLFRKPFQSYRIALSHTDPCNPGIRNTDLYEGQL